MEVESADDPDFKSCGSDDKLDETGGQETDEDQQTENINTDAGAHPLTIPEIRDKIFKYLDKKALLRCRLVNNTWRAEGLALLQKSDHLIQLRLSNFKRHIEYLESLTEPSFLKYEITFDECRDMEICTLLGYIDDLIKLCGPHCILKLAFIVPNNIREQRWEQFFQTMAKVGVGLEQLWVHETQIPNNRSDPPGLQIHSKWKKIFHVIQTYAPGLKHLHIHENDFAVFPTEAALRNLRLQNLTSFSGRMHSEFASAVIFQLVKSSPNLKSLSLFGATEVVEQHRQTRNLLAFLKECYTSKTSLAHLEELEIMVGHDLSYKALQKFEFTKLKTLIIHVMTTICQENAPRLNNFLKNNCPALQSLEVVFSCCLQNNDFANCLPMLPNLSHFGFSLGLEDATTDGISIDQFEGISDKFPSLQSFSIPIGLCIYSYAAVIPCPITGWKKVPIRESDININDATAVLPHFRDWNSDFISLNGFSSVTTLNLKINWVKFRNDTEMSDWQPTLKQNMGQLRSLFPNITKLRVDNQVYPEDNLYQKVVLRELLQTIRGIQELEFQNYTEDWLSQVIYESHAVVQNLTDVRRVRIPEIAREFVLPSSTANQILGLSTQRPIVCLATFLKFMPSLEYLQVASPSASTPWTEHLLEVEELRKSRPNLQFHYL